MLTEVWLRSESLNVLISAEFVWESVFLVARLWLSMIFIVPQVSYTARESQGNYVDNARQKRIVNWQNACLEKCKNNGQRFVDFLAVKNISSDVSSTSITTATLTVKAERCFGYVQSNEGGLCECGSCSISKHQKLVLTQPLGKKGIHVLPLYSRSSLDVTVTLANETQQELFASFGFKPPNNIFPL